MFERFTDRARRAVVLAQEEALLLNHNYIGTEHILLGLISEEENVAARALTGLGISLDAVRVEVEEIIGRAQSAPTGHIPFTPRAKKVLELSLREAIDLGHRYVGPEHILLGVIREGEGVAAQVLQKLGAELNRVRQEVIRLLGAGTAPLEPRCAFCERSRVEVARLLTGPSGRAICDRCAELAAGLASGGETWPPGWREIEEGEGAEAGTGVAGAEAEEAADRTTVPRCPRCRAELSRSLSFRVLEVAGESDEARAVMIVFCTTCGTALGVPR